MSRKCYEQGLVALVLGIVFFAATTVANAADLTTDGDFGSQAININQPPGGPFTYGSYGTPWFGASGWVGNTDEPSPFTNVFPANSIGVGFNGGTGPFIAQTSPTTILASDLGYLYLNVDFKNVGVDTAASYGVVVADGPDYSKSTLALIIGSSTLYAQSSGGALGASLLDPVANKWYNVQLALNTGTNMYSGVITGENGVHTLISNRYFIRDQNINTIYSDTASYTGSYASPAHRIDNFVLSSTPFAPQLLTSGGDFSGETGQVGNATGSPWVPHPSAIAASAAAQSPFTNVFTNNGVGAHSSGSGYIIGNTSSPVASTATGLLYLNADFMNESADAGTYSLVVANNADWYQRTLALYVGGTGLYAESSSNTSLIFTPQVGKWYNVQLTLNTGTNMYSGVITGENGVHTLISSRLFVQDTTIGCIYTDPYNIHPSSTVPVHNIDNYVLSAVPFAARLLTTGGDFGGETGQIGSAAGSPWKPTGATFTASAAAQSPFTNVFTNNGIGATSTGTGPYIVGYTSKVISPTDTGFLYLNVDFKNASDTDGGAYSLVVTNGASYAARALALYVSGTGFYADDGASISASLFAPEKDKWYNVQLTLDIGNDKYTGVVTKEDGTKTLLSGNFAGHLAIDSIFTDTQSVYPNTGNGQVPLHYLDNFVLSAEPLAVIPEPGTLALLATGLLGLLAYAWRKWK